MSKLDGTSEPRSRKHQKSLALSGRWKTLLIRSCPKALVDIGRRWLPYENYCRGKWLAWTLMPLPRKFPHTRRAWIFGSAS